MHDLSCNAAVVQIRVKRHLGVVAIRDGEI
jgi:hypothetical protein